MAGLVRSSRNVILLNVKLISSVTPLATVVAPDVSMPVMMAPTVAPMRGRGSRRNCRSGNDGGCGKRQSGLAEHGGLSLIYGCGR